jgi:hypothetical protein
MGNRGTETGQSRLSNAPLRAIDFYAEALVFSGQPPTTEFVQCCGDTPQVLGEPIAQ